MHVLAKGGSGKLVHLSATGAPRVIRGCRANLGLDVSVALGEVFAESGIKYDVKFRTRKMPITWDHANSAYSERMVLLAAYLGVALAIAWCNCEERKLGINSKKGCEGEVTMGEGRVAR